MTGRHYKIDGERYPSVTTILTTLANDGITAWKLRVGLAEAGRISKDATDYGTSLHSLFERANRDQLDTLSGDEVQAIQAYVNWKNENVNVVLGAEKLLVSRKYGFAGTCDLLAVLSDGKPAILDLKSSRSDLGIREWRLQLAAYCIAADEGGTVCERRVILRMPRAEPGKLYVHELSEDDLEIDKRAFLACLRVFKWNAEVEEQTKKPLGPRIRFNGR